MATNIPQQCHVWKVLVLLLKPVNVVVIVRPCLLSQTAPTMSSTVTRDWCYTNLSDKNRNCYRKRIPMQLHMPPSSNLMMLGKVEHHQIGARSHYSLQGGVIILQTPHYLGEDLFPWLGARFTVICILCTVFIDLVTRYTVLHVHIGMPCRQLNRVETVDKNIILWS